MDKRIQKVYWIKLSRPLNLSWEPNISVSNFFLITNYRLTKNQWVTFLYMYMINLIYYYLPLPREPVEKAPTEDNKLDHELPSEENASRNLELMLSARREPAEPKLLRGGSGSSRLRYRTTCLIVGRDSGLGWEHRRPNSKTNFVSSTLYTELSFWSTMSRILPSS